MLPFVRPVPSRQIRLGGGLIALVSLSAVAVLPQSILASTSTGAKSSAAIASADHSPATLTPKSDVAGPPPSDSADELAPIARPCEEIVYRARADVPVAWKAPMSDATLASDEGPVRTSLESSDGEGGGLAAAADSRDFVSVPEPLLLIGVGLCSLTMARLWRAGR
jgi:hypothetical protein